MRSAKQEKIGPEYGKSEMGLSRCLVDGDGEENILARRARGKTFGFSMGIEILLVGLLVAAPLLTSTAQPQTRKVSSPEFTFLGNPGEHRQNQHAVTQSTAHRPLLPNPFPSLHDLVPPMSARNDEAAEDSSFPDIPGVDITGTAPITEIVGARTPVELPHIVQPPQEKHPVKLSEGVLAAQIISRVEPRYPPLAVQTKQSGTVVLHAIINRDGRIGALEVVSGSPFFVQAALDAVRQWRYRPTMLNGEPVEVETTITVLFRLEH